MRRFPFPVLALTAALLIPATAGRVEAHQYRAAGQAASSATIIERTVRGFSQSLASRSPSGAESYLTVGLRRQIETSRYRTGKLFMLLGFRAPPRSYSIKVESARTRSGRALVTYNFGTQKVIDEFGLTSGSSGWQISSIKYISTT